MKLRALLFHLLFCLWTGVLAIVWLPLFLAPNPIMRKVSAIWAWGTLALLRFFCGIRYEIRGLEHLPRTPCIIASKHQSAWDTIIFHLLTRHPCYVLKRELLWLPLFGLHLMRLGMIAIDRSSGAKALKRIITQMKKVIGENRSVIIFPEGTRSKPGESKPYQPGIAAMHHAFPEVPVIPVALNSGVYWGKHILHKRPGTIVLEFLPPVPHGLKRQAFMQYLYKTIEERSEKLMKEAL